MSLNKYRYSKNEKRFFGKLKTPQKIQNYLNSVKMNLEEKGETCMSPRMVIKTKTAHCMEGAMFAAAALEFHGQKLLVLDLRSIKKPYDDDHVVAIFKKYGCFGAISKTNHAVLRYREPIYKTIRELVISFFHEYFLNNGKKTLREYSRLLDLSHFDKINWRTSSKNLRQIPEFLDEIRHYKILSPGQIKNLRKADEIEIKAGKFVEHTNI